MVFGLLFCVVLAFGATWLGGLQHVMGAPLIGMFLGMLLTNLIPALRAKVEKGASFSSRIILRLGIILCGGTLSFSTILGAGGSALPFIITSIGFAFLTACVIGKYLIRVPVNTRVLVAGGTSICGGTAIATLAGVIDADEDEVGYAMTAIFLFDILATLLWPYVALGLGLSPEQFSILAGVAINDVSSVTAAGATYDALMGSAALSASGVTGGDLAVVVKLTRVVMLVFVAIAVMIWNMRRKGNKPTAHGSAQEQSNLRKIRKAFPFFILGFLGLAILNTILDFSQYSLAGISLAAILKRANKLLITIALVGVGSKMNLRDLFTRGIHPVLLGGCTWIVVALLTFGYVMVLV